MGSSLERLKKEQFPASAIAYLEKLPQAQQQQLADQLVDSMTTKDARVDRALNRALEVVPRPLRGSVRKLLFP